MSPTTSLPKDETGNYKRKGQRTVSFPIILTTFKNGCYSYLQETTVHGFRYILPTNSNFVRIIWVLKLKITISLDSLQMLPTRNLTHSRFCPITIALISVLIKNLEHLA